MKRLGTQRRKAIIIRATKWVIMHEGVDGVTMELVAKECSIPTSVSTIRYHFHTIDELLKAVK